MRVLLIGSGGREHAFAWKLAQSEKLTKLYIAPGNPGTASCGENVDLDCHDFESIGKFSLSNKIDMIVVGPEAPLVAGIYDYFANDPALRHIAFIGPSRQGAALEGSKDFAKVFMEQNKIPTAAYCTVTRNDLEEGYRFLDTLIAPYVLKADGLAGGKGVVILNDLVAAKSMLKEMLGGKFGTASNKVVIEEYLHGIEVSVFVLTDGVSYKLLPEAKDYKRIGENDEGLNTGGMGAVSPVPFVDADFLKKVCDRIVTPTLTGLQQAGITYKGFIFLGLMNCGGDPYTIEYNVRMGDPETEAVMPRLNADLLDLFEGVAQGDLEKRSCNIFPDTTLTVVMTSGGYPNAYETGFEIKGLEEETDSIVFHAGTMTEGDKILTNSGRVLAVTAKAGTITEARQKVYDSLNKLSFRDGYYRRDIGNDLLNR